MSVEVRIRELTPAEQTRNVVTPRKAAARRRAYANAQEKRLDDVLRREVRAQESSGHGWEIAPRALSCPGCGRPVRLAEHDVRSSLASRVWAMPFLVYERHFAEAGGSAALHPLAYYEGPGYEAERRAALDDDLGVLLCRECRASGGLDWG